MLEILEKMPGISVERGQLPPRQYTALPSSRAAAAGDVRQRQQTSRRSSRAALMVARSSPAPSNNAAPRNSDSKRFQLAADPPPRVPSRARRPSARGHQHELVEHPGPFMVEGKSATTTAAAVDVRPPSPPPDASTVAPKSILKRSGSARSIGVVSLDSGMSRLTASLNNKRRPHDVAKKVVSVATTKPEVGDDASPPELTAVPLLQRKIAANNAELRSIKATTTRKPLPEIAPVKSVSFNLEPEKFHFVDEAPHLVRGRPRGEARWEVGLSSVQERRPSHSSQNHKPTTGDIHEGKVVKTSQNNTSRKLSSSLDASCIKDRSQRRHHLLDGGASPGGLLRPRPDGGMGGVSGIHLIADPYRRYLMARALQDTENFATKQRNDSSSERDQSIVESRSFKSREQTTHGIDSSHLPSVADERKYAASDGVRSLRLSVT